MSKAGVSSKTAFFVQDYAATDFEDDSFDRIYTTESLSHAKSVEQVLSEFYRILKPGGILVCAEYEMDHKHFDHETKRLAKPLAGAVKKLHLENRFVNITAAAMYSNGVESGVFAYKVYICKK